MALPGFPDYVVMTGSAGSSVRIQKERFMLDRFVRAYDYDNGELSRPRVFADTQQFNSGPDGATVDAEGHVWVALVNVGKLARFTPSGKLERLLEAPTDMPSCPAFGGPDLSTLYVTSIKDSGSGRAISRHPQGGHLFAIDGLGIRGLAEPRMKLTPSETPDA